MEALNSEDTLDLRCSKQLLLLTGPAQAQLRRVKAKSRAMG